MKKLIKIATIFTALTIVLTGCDLLSNPMKSMEEVNDDFTAAMKSDGYSMEIKYTSGGSETLYSLGNDQYFYRSELDGQKDEMSCNIDGKYEGNYDGVSYDEFGWDEAAIISYCDEAIKYFEERYDFMLEGMYQDNIEVEYENNKDDYRAFGEYEPSTDPDVTTGEYELIISKDAKTLKYNDEAVKTVMTIGDKEY